MSSSSRHTLLQAWYHTAFRSHVLLSQIPSSRWNREFSPKPSIRQVKGVDASFRDSVFVCFLLLPSDHSIQRTSPSLFRKCTSHTLAARVAILLPFFPHHVGPTPSFSAPSCVRCHQSTPSARCIGCRSLPHGTHLSCAQLENRKGVRVSAQPHQPTPHLLHVILHST